MAHGCHVVWRVAGSQSVQVVVEDNIHDPLQLVLDGSVSAHGGGELFGIEGRGGNVEASCGRSLAVGLALALDIQGG